MAKIYIKETDSEIVLRVNADLTGSTVRVVVRPNGSTTSLPDLSSAITNATRGEITVQTGSLTAGSYSLEIEQNQAGKIAHYPSKGYDLLIVGADLG